MLTSPHPPQQKYLGARGLIMLIALLSAFVPLSTDLYLPALPGMGKYFGAPADQINLTLTAFFVCYSLGTLVWGPLSDRYGRRPVLLCGLAIYVLASAACSLAGDVWLLILFRSLQAAGGSAAGAVATAIVKDVYSGRRREAVLAIVQSMVLISPAVAPFLGALLLNWMSWRGVFWTLTGIGGLALLGSALLVETIPERNAGHLLHTLGRLGNVFRNRGFTQLMLLFSLGSFSSMAFIASSTYIYQDIFQLSSQWYSFYFAISALGMIAGPMIYLRLSRWVHPESMIRACFLATALSGLLVCLFGGAHPLIFALCLLPSSIAGSCIRPPSANLMLEQQQGDTGALVSVMSCVALLMGSLGIQVISFDWPNRILALGAITLAAPLLSLALWPLVIKQAQRFPRSQPQAAD